MSARRERGAALLLLMSVLVVVAAAAGVALLEQAAAREPGQWDEQQRLALAADALRGAAFQRRCVTPALAPDALLACPETGGVEGVAAAGCPGVTRGWLPWRTLGLPPLRDGSGTCLWYERSGSTARIIAPGAALAGQDRTTLPGRTSCAGNSVAANYLDAGDAEVGVVLDLAQFAARCP